MVFYFGIDLLQNYLQAYTPSLKKSAAWPYFFYGGEYQAQQ